ncbi:hypothetical protein BGY98DRAFT_293472 [Russula aff. rugulosa BPL654]|nr:hypothetical protein BGY98DRAFT_293472 [Russula aff. rugulosa BPL654]
MNEFTEDHSARLLSKEWLVKIDNERSIPYLMKLHPTFGNQSCVFLITDTKTVWAEVLSKQQLSRRWSMLNINSAQSHLPHPTEDDGWLDQVLQYLVDVHTPHAMGDLSFDVMIDSRYSDLAIQFRGEGFEWRWETFSIGPKQSAEVLSKHLMIPLLSTAYLALISPDAISEISASALEKAVDRVGRTARRSMDTHVRNIFSQPRACTSIRRLSALFAFSADLPAIVDEFENPEPTLPQSVDSAAGSHQTLNKTPTVQRPSINLEHAQSPNSRQMEIESGDEHHTKAMTTTRQGPGTGVLGQATTGNPPTKAGQDDDDGDILALSEEKRSGKQKMGDVRSTAAGTSIQGKSASRISSTPASSVPGSHARPASAARSSVLSKTSSSDSDSDSPQRPNKRAKTKDRIATAMMMMTATMVPSAAN